MKKPKVVVIIDGPDPDNYACLLAALSGVVCFEVIAVIMTGRPVSATVGALPHAFNPYASEAVGRDNALHAAGIIHRHAGGRIPVFQGGIAPFTKVPHELHLHERITDIYDDAHAGFRLAGDIKHAVAYLAQQEGPIHFICGGPMTDLAQLMREPLLYGKLGIVTAQLGMFGFGGVQTIAGGRRQFNVLTDAWAAHDVLMKYPASFYMIPSDVTKHKLHGFKSVDELARLATSKAFKEIVAMYLSAWAGMWGNRGIDAHMHDFHPVEVMDALLRAGHHLQTPTAPFVLGRYGLSPVSIKHVPHLADEMERWGEIDLREQPRPGDQRFLVDKCDTTLHRLIVAKTLNAVAEVSHDQLLLA